MIRLMKLHTKDGPEYMIRACPTVFQVSNPAEGSVIKECEECDAAIWYDTKQKAPVLPGRNIAGEVVLCLSCVQMHIAYDGEPADWHGPVPDWVNPE